jgi:lipopolysaccharide transport system permease protein
MLLVFCLIFHQPVSISALIYFPLAILILLITSFGLGTLLGALNVKYRDFRYALPFFLQFLFFATQIIYSANIIQQSWLQYLFALNPVNTAIELFRHPFGTAIHENMVYIGLFSSLLIALAGLFYFKKTESYFADIV